MQSPILFLETKLKGSEGTAFILVLFISKGNCTLITLKIRVII